jgi:hypothetical protein
MLEITASIVQFILKHLRAGKFEPDVLPEDIGRLHAGVMGVQVISQRHLYILIAETGVIVAPPLEKSWCRSDANTSYQGRGPLFLHVTPSGLTLAEEALYFIICAECNLVWLRLDKQRKSERRMLESHVASLLRKLYELRYSIEKTGLQESALLKEIVALLKTFHSIVSLCFTNNTGGLHSRIRAIEPSLQLTFDAVFGVFLAELTGSGKDLKQIVTFMHKRLATGYDKMASNELEMLADEAEVWLRWITSIEDRYLYPYMVQSLRLNRWVFGTGTSAVKRNPYHLNDLTHCFVLDAVASKHNISHTRQEAARTISLLLGNAAGLPVKSRLRDALNAVEQTDPERMLALMQFKDWSKVEEEKLLADGVKRHYGISNDRWNSYVKGGRIVPIADSTDVRLEYSAAQAATVFKENRSPGRHKKIVQKAASAQRKAV